MDFKTKLAFALVAASLLSMSALGYFTHLWTEDAFLADTRGQIELLADMREVELVETFAAWHNEMERLVERLESAEVDPEPTGPTALVALAGILEEAQRRSATIRSWTLEPPRGAPAIAPGAEPAAEPPSSPAFASSADGLDPATTSSGGGKVVFVGVRVDAAEHLRAVFRSSIQRDGESVARLEVDFGGAPIERLLGPTRHLGESGRTLLVVPERHAMLEPGVDADGPIVIGGLHRTTGVAGDPETAVPAIRAVLAGERRVFDAVRDQSEALVMAAARPLGEPGWGLVVQVDRDEARARADGILANMRRLGISLAAIAILAGTLLGFRLAGPIAALVQDVDRIRHGELGRRIEVRGEDEVAFLARSLNEFMDQLDRSSDLFRLGALNVLVISGERAERRRLRDLLGSWNMRPRLVEDAAAALRAIGESSQLGDALQLVLLDESVPDMELAQFVEKLRASSDEPLPVILLAAEGAEPPGETLERAGLRTVLPKPVIASHLMEAILDEMGVSAEALTSMTDVFLKPTEPRRILLAEDNALVQRVMLGFLENWGHEVRLAENGRRAVELARSEPFDLILMDVEMPEMNGLEATAAIRALEDSGESASGGSGAFDSSDASSDPSEARRTPIVALTAEALPSDRERCMAAGMDEFVTKPADPKALYALINRVPAGRRASAARVASGHGSPREEAASVAVGDPGAAASDDETRVDWRAAREFTNGNEDLLRELVELFPSESAAQLAAVRQAIRERNAELLTRSAHTLKGNARVFGATEVADRALAIEQVARRGEIGSAEALVDGLEAATARLNEALAAGEPQASGGRRA